MKNRNVVYIFIISMLVIISCTSPQQRIDELVSNLTGRKIDVPLYAMEKKTPKCYTSNINDTSETSYKLVTYIDSTACSPCGIDHLFEWGTIIDESKEKNYDIKFIFIVAPKKAQLIQTYYAISHCTLYSNIYVDTSYMFMDNNPCMEKGYIFETFLLDKDDRIALVGNPIKNPKIHDLITNIIKSK